MNEFSHHDDACDIEFISPRSPNQVILDIHMLFNYNIEANNRNIILENL